MNANEFNGQSESLIAFRTSQGVTVQRSLVRLTRYGVVFQLSQPVTVVRTSEALSDFQIILSDQLAYSGKALLSSIVDTGGTAICQAKIDETGLNMAVFSGEGIVTNRQPSFTDFIKGWQKNYRILPRFKAVVSDIQTFLHELRLWLDSVEMRVYSEPHVKDLVIERQVGGMIAKAAIPALTEMFEQFEETARQVEPDQREAHSCFVKRMLHPFLLCSPFLRRTYQKPLGYAGDYEMVNMLVRDPWDGDSMFAKVINSWFLAQPPAQAHRNRVEYLEEALNRTTAGAIHAGTEARFMSLGCGPALEVQRFLEQKEFSDRARFTLLDFSQESLEHARSRLEEVKWRCHRSTSLHLVNKSVNAILKESARGSSEDPNCQFDLVYCAGLYDYLSDAVCRRLGNALFGMVAPGGTLVVTNVDVSNPRRPTMDFIMDWHLIYRDAAELAALRPEQAAMEDCAVKADFTGVNIFMEVRKPRIGGRATDE